jgi:exodeoxyribonuclease-5
MDDEGMRPMPGMVSPGAPAKQLKLRKPMPPGVERDNYRVWFDETCFTKSAIETGASSGAPSVPSSLSPDQETVYDAILKWYRGSGPQVLTLGGFAGTGKSTLVALLARELRNDRVSFAAFTGKAATNLRSKMVAAKSLGPRHDVGTLHSLLYQSFTDDEGRLKWQLKKEDALMNHHLVVIEEASMPPDWMVEDLKAMGVRILAVGDHGQLPPVMGASSLMKRPDLRLETIHRQAAGNPIIELSRQIRESGTLPRTPPGGNGGAISYVKQADIETVWKDVYEEKGLSECAVIAWTNRMRSRLNRGLRSLFFKGTAPEGRPRPGDQVICLKNAYKTVFNGMRGFVEDVHETVSPNFFEGSVHFPSDGVVFHGSFTKHLFLRDKGLDSLSDLEEFGVFADEWEDFGLQLDYGYALTCHKAQGSQWHTVGVVRERPHGVSSDQYKRWLYTAVTRASDRLFIFV